MWFLCTLTLISHMQVNTVLSSSQEKLLDEENLPTSTPR